MLFDEAFGPENSEPPRKLPLPRRIEEVKWFLLPWEAWQYGHGNSIEPVTKISFAPKLYKINGIAEASISSEAALRGPEALKAADNSFNSISATLKAYSGSEAIDSVPAT